MKALRIVKALATNSVLRRFAEWLATVLSLLILIWRFSFPFRAMLEPERDWSGENWGAPEWLPFASWVAAIWVTFVYLRLLWRKFKEGYQSTA